jgi:hypothetical protein
MFCDLYQIYHKTIIKNYIFALFQSAIGTLIIAIAFMTIEPTVSFALVTSATSQFTVSQTVGKEIGFATLATNVTMSPVLGGITGGTSNGIVSVAVRTNDLSGYSMTIQASTSLGMQGVASSSNYIAQYTPASPTVPDYNFRTDINGFGYNVNASTTTDVPLPFRYTGSACNTGSTVDSLHCWFPATSSAYTIINRNTITPTTGATTTLSFMVNLIPNNMLPNDTYVATTTLTAIVN